MENSQYPAFVRLLATKEAEKKRFIIAPDTVAHSDGLACGDHLSIELSLINDKCEFNVHADGCLLCRASTRYMINLLNEKSIQEIRNMTADFLSALNETYTYIEILGPWQTYQIPEDRKECVVSPWRLLIAAIDSLPTVCSTDRKLTPLACDACVQSHRITWNIENSVKTSMDVISQFTQFLKDLHQLDLPVDFHWQPLGKCVLSPSSLKRLQLALEHCGEQDMNAIKKMRLPALLYNNLLTIDSIPKDHGISLLVKRQRIRHYVSQREIAKIEEMIHLQNWRILPVKGAVTSKLYISPAIRPHLDYDFVAASMEESFALASWLMSVRGFRFVIGGSVPFSLKVIVDHTGREVLSGHFHLEKIIYDKYQVVIDINFPGFPLSRTSLFQPTFAKNEPSWEEQLVITLCHIFKHEFVFMKDINDAYLLLKSKKVNKQLLANHLKQHNLEFFYQLLIAFLEQDYNIPAEREFVFNKKNLNILIINWLLKKRWPYSRKAHFYAKAIDLVIRNNVRHGLLGAFRELIRQSFGTNKKEVKGVFSRKLGVPLNTRLYLFPVAIFNRYLLLKDMQSEGETAFIAKKDTVVSEHLVIVNHGEIRIVVTAMGLFLPTTELQTIPDKQAFTILAKSVLAKFKLEVSDILIGATQAARQDLWLF